MYVSSVPRQQILRDNVQISLQGCAPTGNRDQSGAVKCNKDQAHSSHCAGTKILLFRMSLVHIQTGWLLYRGNG